MRTEPDRVNIAVTSGGVYSDFADAYFASGERAFSERMAEFALDRAARYMKTPLRRAADLACGIGAACVVFARKGLDVQGVDQSATMIRNAKILAESSGQSISFLQQTLRDFRLDHTVELVTCMYDSLNFTATEADLLAVFRSVKESLAQGGLFIFDMYTIRGLAEYWGSKAEIHTVTPSHFVATQTKWSFETLTNTKILYGFSLRDGQWQRWEERHVLHAYPVTRICEILIAAGFVILEAIDWDQPELCVADERTQRLVLVAEPRT